MVDEDDATPRKPWVYEPLPSAELEQLAQDMVAGKVFHSGMCKEFHEVLMVFLPLSLLSDKQTLEEMRDQEVVAFYEYLDKAGPRSTNGMPCFFSVRVLNRQQAMIVAAKVRELDKLLAERKGG